jgi:hypothetical protein
LLLHVAVNSERNSLHVLQLVLSFSDVTVLYPALLFEIPSSQRISGGGGGDGAEKEIATITVAETASVYCN